MLKYTQIKLTYVVQIYNEQEDYEAFKTLIETYSNYASSILKHIHFIFVDDHSPLPITLPEDCKLNYTLTRITTNISWNQGGARNLGVHLAKSQKLIVTDLDHTFPQSVFQFLLHTNTPDNIFLFSRNRNNQPVIAHFNTFFLSKSTYFKVLGVDEEFCGNYGHEDVFFLDFQKRLGTKIATYKDQVITAIEHKDTDKPQHNLIRDEEATRPLYDAKRRVLFNKNRDPFEAHSRLFLNFEWKIVSEDFKI